MYVKERFSLDFRHEDHLRSLVAPFGYNGFGELVFYRTYSRTKTDGGQEDWADVVVRITNGTMSIRKDWYVKNHISWDEAWWQDFARKFAESMYKMEWMPPGRGLWAMGSDFVYQRGSMALYNCAALNITNDMGPGINWLMDTLMNGVGVGFNPIRNDDIIVYQPTGSRDYVIPDTREGWCVCTEAIINSYLKCDQLKVRPIYDLIRPNGSPIRSFGGIASGPEPLRELHERVVGFLERYRENRDYDSIRLKTDIANSVGVCVVAGNARRSAELACGSVHDQTFLDLKDYKKNPEREPWGWMSNNSVILRDDEDFQQLGQIARRVIHNGEPGFLNLQNFPYGRIGKKMKGLRKDRADCINPCAEIPLEGGNGYGGEVCNISETLPTVCNDVETWLRACEFATFYCTTVSLLPTHQPATNKIVTRNRRIGVSIIDVSGWKHEYGTHKVIQWMRDGYDKIRQTAKWSNEEAGIPLPIRHSCIKPGGTVPKLPGKTPGIGHPNFTYMIRRIRIAKNSAIHPLLVEANIPYEQDVVDRYTDVFEYPIMQGPAKPIGEVSLWEQAMNLIMVQREWADNSVSNTLTFKPKWSLIKFIDSGYIQDTIVEYIGVVAAFHLIISDHCEYVMSERYKIVLTRGSDGDVLSASVYEYDENHEEGMIEAVLSAIAPLTKSVSLLPHSDKGAYKQMPEEGITKAEYERRLSKISPIDWSEFSGSEGIDEKFCTSESCEMPISNYGVIK
jgi:ribonucleoside-diphosphate reductase alpha chain